MILRSAQTAVMTHLIFKTGHFLRLRVEYRIHHDIRRIFKTHFAPHMRQRVRTVLRERIMPFHFSIAHITHPIFAHRNHALCCGFHQHKPDARMIQQTQNQFGIFFLNLFVRHARIRIAKIYQARAARTEHNHLFVLRGLVFRVGMFCIALRTDGDNFILARFACQHRAHQSRRARIRIERFRQERVHIVPRFIRIQFRKHIAFALDQCLDQFLKRNAVRAFECRSRRLPMVG